jgi:hypothetical protein
LNYFIYPYAEVDGKPYEKLEKKFAFSNSGHRGAVAGR